MMAGGVWDGGDGRAESERRGEERRPGGGVWGGGVEDR